MNPFAWFRRSRLDDVSDEIRSHIEEKTDEFVASGMSRADAELAARRASRVDPVQALRAD